METTYRRAKSHIDDRANPRMFGKEDTTTISVASLDVLLEVARSKFDFSEAQALFLLDVCGGAAIGVHSRLQLSASVADTIIYEPNRLEAFGLTLEDGEALIQQIDALCACGKMAIADSIFRLLAMSDADSDLLAQLREVGLLK